MNHEEELTMMLDPKMLKQSGMKKAQQRWMK